MVSQLAARLLEWYHHNRRELPWRENPQPYAVWVAEIMLQQTRVEAVIPYFRRWMARFPTILDLAAASEQEVLALWEGLGYYRRARNLLRAARIVVERYQGEFPSDPRLLAELPGVGRYTAGAIASIGLGQDAAAIDGNVRRVFSRYFDIEAPARSSDSEKQLWALAEQHLPAGRAGEFNQALMDLGALLCLPRAPACDRCPLRSGCQAFAAGTQEERPVRRKAAPRPHHLVAAAVIQRNGRVLIAQRPADGLLGGMWEFPGGKVEEGEDFATALRREIREELGFSVRVGESIGVYEHAYTHFKVTLHAYRCSVVSGRPRPAEAQDFRWVSITELGNFPMGKIDRQIARRLSGSYRP